MSRSVRSRWKFKLRGHFQGNLTNLIEMTHWKGNDVLYIGDHIYGDLAVRDAARASLAHHSTFH